MGAEESMSESTYRHGKPPAQAAIDVFLCHVPVNAERIAMYSRVRAYWLQQPVRLTTLTPDKLGCSARDFQRLRRAYADRKSTSSIYLLSDDDCLPISPSEWRKGLDALIHNRDFGILSALPTNAKINSWKPERYTPVYSSSVMEHHSVGGLRFCRARLLGKWPALTGSGYDSEHCAALRSLTPPWRVGYATDCRIEHLGEGKSIVWKTS